MWLIGDTLRLLGAIETHRNRAVYISLNTNANPTSNPNTNPNPNPNPDPNPNPNLKCNSIIMALSP